MANSIDAREPCLHALQEAASFARSMRVLDLTKANDRRMARVWRREMQCWLDVAQQTLDDVTDYIQDLEDEDVR